MNKACPKNQSTLELFTIGKVLSAKNYLVISRLLADIQRSYFQPKKILSLFERMTFSLPGVTSKW